MLERLEESEIEFMECMNNSLALAECLFSNYDNLTVMEEETLGHVRLGQLPLLSYEYMLDYNPELPEKENFTLRKGAGDIYCLGGRLFGKTLLVEKVDMLINMVLSENERVGFSSYDQIHVRGVLEDVIQVLDNHPFFKLFSPHTNKSPNYRITLNTGYLLESVNMNISGKKPGAQFFQKHFTRLYIEEASFETEQVYNQRRDSVSENGCVFRISGMTNFTKYSPCGKVFYDFSRKNWVVNLPQYINPKWDSNAKELAKKDFGGEQSLGFRVFIRGEVVEDGVSVFDMERVRKNYNDEKYTKVFEINKENYFQFEHLLIIERPANADNCFVFADIGESAPTEIGIVFETNRIYKYVYNITAYNLTDKEQEKLFNWIGTQLGANFIALDCTDGTGRAVYRRLAEVFPKENLVWVSFNEKIPIAFEKDDKGNVKFEKGEPIIKEEYVAEWSVQNLKQLLYAERMEIPLDHKFDSQFNSVLALQSGARTIYECISSENHLFQAFQVFSIAQFFNEFNTAAKALRKREFFKGLV
jgi:hypothetical protein